MGKITSQPSSSILHHYPPYDAEGLEVYCSGRKLTSHV